MRRLIIRLVRWIGFAMLLVVGLGLISLGLFGDFGGRDHRGRDKNLFERGMLHMFLLGIGAGIPLLYASRPREYSTRMAGAFEKLGREVSGTATHTGLLDPDMDLTWTRGNTRGHLHAWIDEFQTSGKNNAPPPKAHFRFRYAIETPAPGATFRLEIRPETLLQRAAKLFGLQDLSLNNRVLDRELLVQSSDETEYRRCLERGLTQTLAHLRQLDEELGVFHVSYVPGRLVVQRSVWVVWGRTREDALVDDLHEIAMSLLRATTALDLGQALRQGGNLVEVQVLEPVSEDAACLVCGDRIGTEHVACVKCETPHHRDCWSYNGACALYACGSKDAKAAAGRTDARVTQA